MDPVKTPVVDPPKTAVPPMKAQPHLEPPAPHAAAKPTSVEPKPKA